MRRLIIILSIIILMTACTPKPEQVKPYVDQTLTALPTRTQYPTNTAYPTYTKEPTLTQVVITKVVTATRTLTPTLTRTPTNTPTPINSPTPTQPPTATFTSWQETAAAVKATNDFFAQYVAPDRRDFITYPDKYEDQKIKVQCRIYNVVGNYQLQCYVTGTYDAFYVFMKNRFDSLYENDYITIYGVGDSVHCFESTMGVNVCQPKIKDAYFTKP